MEFIKKNIWLKGDLIVGAVALLLVVIGFLTGNRFFVSDLLFMSGLVLICVMIIDILLHAHLMAGWFQRQRKGESDEEFEKRKIDIRRVASEKKNGPIHFKKLGFNCLVLACYLIILAVITSL